MRTRFIVGFSFLLILPTLRAEQSQARNLRDLIQSGKLAELRWPGFSPMRGYLTTFYESRGYSPAWTRERAPTIQAAALIGLLQHADKKGLNPEDYDGSRWTDRLARLRRPRADQAEEDLIVFDLALTVCSMRYISDLEIGRVNPRVFCFGLDTDQKECHLAEVESQLWETADVAGLVSGLEPLFPGYRRTEQALERYIELARIDDGELLPATKKPVQPGDAYPGIARLEQLLRLLGDLPAETPSPPNLYEGSVVDAVKHFQARHGLDVDGRIGRTTLEQLNTPLQHRVLQLELTLERWRWVPSSFSRPPIVVNIPEFRLHALDERYESELEMKVVVGGAYRHQTPVFSNDMTSVIFRPYWIVPLSIQRAELVPKIAKDPGYLAANDYEIVDAHTNVVRGDVTADTIQQLNSGKLQIRQKPGGLNALGLIKFLFPNVYDVYLHGTPAKALFSKSRRDFSHGCIRVESPEELAAWVLQDLPEWTPECIRQAENGAATRQVNLPQPIPVFIVYGTVIVSRTGEIFFFDDIYGHDKSLADALSHGYPYSGWRPSPPRFGKSRAGSFPQECTADRERVP